MDFVYIVIIVLNLLGMAYLGVRLHLLDTDVHATIQDAISQQIRLQDDRIEKRVKRAEGQPTDVPETHIDGRVGQPFRR